MGYMRDLERELRDLLTGVPEDKTEPIVRFVKARVYDSYKNGRDGVATEPKSAPAAPEPPEPPKKPSRARQIAHTTKFRRS